MGEVQLSRTGQGVGWSLDDGEAVRGAFTLPPAFASLVFPERQLNRVLGSAQQRTEEEPITQAVTATWLYRGYVQFDSRLIGKWRDTYTTKNTLSECPVAVFSLLCELTLHPL